MYFVRVVEPYSELKLHMARDELTLIELASTIVEYLLELVGKSYTIPVAKGPTPVFQRTGSKRSSNSFVVERPALWDHGIPHLTNKSD